MACRLFDTKPLITPLMTYCKPDTPEHIPVKLYLKAFPIYEMRFKLSSEKYLSATGTLIYWHEKQPICKASNTTVFENKHLLQNL